MSDRAERIAWFMAGVLPHKASLRRFLRRTGAPDIDLDDLVSEALTRTYATEDWSRITNGRSYLFTIARNLVFDAARQHKDRGLRDGGGSRRPWTCGRSTVGGSGCDDPR